MIDSRTAPYGALLLRLVLGGLFLIHVGVKLFVFTPAGFVGFFGSLGLPPIAAYADMAWELVGGVMLLLGIWSRPVAVLLMPVLIGAIGLVHFQAGFLFTNPNGGWEYPAFWAVALLALALVGDGAYALFPTPVLKRRVLQTA